MGCWTKLVNAVSCRKPSTLDANDDVPESDEGEGNQNNAAQFGPLATVDVTDPKAIEALESEIVDLRTSDAPFDQIRPQFERLVAAAMTYENPKAADESSYIAFAPKMLLRAFTTWSHDAAAPIFDKVLDLMSDRAKVFRQRNEKLEMDYLVLTSRGLSADTPQVAAILKRMQSNDAKVANVYHYAIFMLQRYGEQWNDDPRALPLLDITVDMAYEACCLANRHATVNDTNAMKMATRGSQAAFDALEKSLSSEHKEISDFAFQQLAPFKEQLCKSLEMEGKNDADIRGRYERLISSYRSKHGADNVPQTGMEELD